MSATAAPERKAARNGVGDPCKLCPCVLCPKVECDCCGRVVCRYCARPYFADAATGTERLVTVCVECYRVTGEEYPAPKQ